MTKLVLSPNLSSISMFSIVHAGAIISLFQSSNWQAVAFAMCLYIAMSGLGWSVGIHRGLIHGSFKTYRWLENLLALLGALSGLGGPISSSRTHFVREYCQNNFGIEGLPNNKSFFSNYFPLPIFFNYRLLPSPSDPTTAELERRWFFRMLEYRWGLNALFAAFLFIAGGLDFVVWGLCVRTAVTLNIFACFDYFCHSPQFGSQRFLLKNVPSSGRNHWLMSFLTWGEGWHNNHHAMPSSPRMGMAWYEIDLGFEMIKLLRSIGLVWDLVDPREAIKSNAHLAAATTHSIK